MEAADQTGEGGKHLSHKARSFLPCHRLICSVCFHLPWRAARNVNCMNEGQLFHFPGWPSTCQLHWKMQIETRMPWISRHTYSRRMDGCGRCLLQCQWGCGANPFITIYSVHADEPTIQSKSRFLRPARIICYFSRDDIWEGSCLWQWDFVIFIHTVLLLSMLVQWVPLALFKCSHSFSGIEGFSWPRGGLCN